MSKIFKRVIWIPKKLWNYTKKINNLSEELTEIKEGVSSGLELTSKIFASPTKAAKETVDDA